MIDSLGLSSKRAINETIQESRLRNLYTSRAMANYGHNEKTTTNQRVEQKKNQQIRATGRVGLMKRCGPESLKTFPPHDMVMIKRTAPGMPERGFGAVLPT
jgi:hypothetical protein